MSEVHYAYKKTFYIVCLKVRYVMASSEKENQGFSKEHISSGLVGGSILQCIYAGLLPGE